MATMSLIGLFSYRPDLFDNMTLPEGINKDILCDNILTRSADFEVLYSDPDFLKDSIRIWSAKWYRTFQKWQTALSIEYDPLSNYDRKEEWTDIGSGSRNTSGKTVTDGSEKRSAEGESNVTGTVNDETQNDTENKVSAFNSGTYQPDSTTDTSGTSKSEIDNKNTSKNDENVKTDSETNTTGKEDTTNTNKRTGRAWGNIGVMTSQQMLEAELSVAEWNLYDHITDVFLREYVIPIY